MKATGIVRKLDQLGRIVLPVELRRLNGLEIGTPVEIYVDGDDIILRKYKQLCILCDGSEDVIQFNGKNVCKKCLAYVKTL